VDYVYSVEILTVSAGIDQCQWDRTTLAGIPAVIIELPESPEMREIA
jgi:hypothetical protein